MDSRFLEYLGHFFLNAARSQHMLTQMQTWMGIAPSGNKALDDLFRKFYGLDPRPGEDADQTAAWQKAFDSFQASLSAWLELMAVVPRSEYEALEKKVHDLEEKLAAQENTIRRLRQVGVPDGDTPVAAVGAFTKLMEKQADEFQELMQNINEAFKPEE